MYPTRELHIGFKDWKGQTVSFVWSDQEDGESQ
jgi:hypothetical protein